MIIFASNMGIGAWMFADAAVAVVTAFITWVCLLSEDVDAAAARDDAKVACLIGLAIIVSITALHFV